MIWTEIRNQYQDEFIIHIDAWESNDDKESGKVIAKVNLLTNEVEYIDKRAIMDSYAQSVINESLKTFKEIKF